MTINLDCSKTGSFLRPDCRCSDEILSRWLIVLKTYYDVPRPIENVGRVEAHGRKNTKVQPIENAVSPCASNLWFTLHRAQWFLGGLNYRKTFSGVFRFPESPAQDQPARKHLFLSGSTFYGVLSGCSLFVAIMVKDIL